MSRPSRGLDLIFVHNHPNGHAKHLKSDLRTCLSHTGAKLLIVITSEWPYEFVYVRGRDRMVLVRADEKASYEVGPGTAARTCAELEAKSWSTGAGEDGISSIRRNS